MAYKSDMIKKITFVGIVFLTLVLFVVALVHGITTEDSPSSEEIIDVLGQSGVEESSDLSGGEASNESATSGNASENGEISSEISEESSQEEPSEDGYMVGATHDTIDGIYVSSPYCFVYDATDNVILYEKNAYDKCYPASVTKLLTAAVALEYVPVETVFKVGSEIQLVGYNSSMAYIVEGQSFTLHDLLYALLLPSGNDAAYTIAVNTSRYLYGDNLTNEEAVEAFMKLCGEKLTEIGAYNTHFICPDGYHNDDHYTTAYDMALISLYATSFEEITTACGTYEFYCKSAEGDALGWYNTNPLMKKNGQYYCEFVTGLKTGSTTEAGKCLATLAEKDGKKLYVVVLGSSTVEIRNNDTLAIIRAVLGS